MVDEQIPGPSRRGDAGTSDAYLRDTDGYPVQDGCYYNIRLPLDGRYLWCDYVTFTSGLILAALADMSSRFFITDKFWRSDVVLGLHADLGRGDDLVVAGVSGLLRGIRVDAISGGNGGDIYIRGRRSGGHNYIGTVGEGLRGDLSIGDHCGANNEANYINVSNASELSFEVEFVYAGDKN